VLSKRDPFIHTHRLKDEPNPRKQRTDNLELLMMVTAKDINK